MALILHKLVVLWALIILHIACAAAAAASGNEVRGPVTALGHVHLVTRPASVQL